MIPEPSRSALGDHFAQGFSHKRDSLYDPLHVIAIRPSSSFLLELTAFRSMGTCSLRGHAPHPASPQEEVPNAIGSSVTEHLRVTGATSRRVYALLELGRSFLPLFALRGRLSLSCEVAPEWTRNSDRLTPCVNLCYSNGVQGERAKGIAKRLARKPAHRRIGTKL